MMMTISGHNWSRDAQSHFHFQTILGHSKTFGWHCAPTPCRFLCCVALYPQQQTSKGILFMPLLPGGDGWPSTTLVVVVSGGGCLPIVEVMFVGDNRWPSTR
ncbi:unnamed protein product [Cuscuta campestris]|uniref:Uncharacterized protein n=1 Tax=Cuscuta campestris TaxID=132261 RepID=A0A484M117_9ASTE|nr:unnamed protein product [Cuscuta campestris]